jgi:NAD+ diphosphatase
VPRFQPAPVAPEPPPAEALCFCVRGAEVLVFEVDGATAVPSLDELEQLGLASSLHYLGALDSTAYYAVPLDAEAEPPTGMTFHGLRPLAALLPEELFGIAGRAVQIVEWDDTHRFCGRCGTPTERAQNDRAKRCPACGLLAFPRVAPAVIVRVTRAEEILLGRNRRFPEPIYSVIAGFVEPGESLEDTVAREVHEEAGVEIRDVRYFGSQPWPFPHQLMVGFTAEYASGEIRIDEEELVHAAWFPRNDLPRLPPGFSIARRLIDDWLRAEPHP